MKYRIIQNIEGKFSKTEIDGDFDAAILWAAELGFEFLWTGRTRHVRAELQGQPVFSGLCGPMWDGDAIRYEDRVSYRILST